MVKPSLLAPCVLLLHLLPGSQAEEGSEAEPLGVRGLELGPLHEPSQGNPALGRPMGGSGGGPQTSGFLGLPRGKGIVRLGGGGFQALVPTRTVLNPWFLQRYEGGSPRPWGEPCWGLKAEALQRSRRAFCSSQGDSGGCLSRGTENGNGSVPFLQVSDTPGNCV